MSSSRPLDTALGGRYELHRLLATGGMGEVWVAEDTVLGREVACKVLKAEFADDADFRERFVNEARSAAQLTHPSIAGVFDFGQRPGERPFLVMELVDGPPLTEVIHRGVLDPARARALVADVAEALGAAHAVGLVHRDVKPGNILVTSDGKAKLTDFGIARAADGVPLTRTGEIVGTPAYISPEQAEGKPATAASDVYALGCVLFECLTGRKPYEGEGPVATALMHLREPVPELPPEIPADLTAITRRAMAKDPAERFADGATMAAVLRGAPDTTQVLTLPPAAARTAAAAPWWQRHWALLVTAAVAVLLLGGFALAALRDEPSTTPVNQQETVAVVAADYVGKDVAQVRAALKALGLESVVRTKANPGGQKAGTVAAVAPTGQLPLNTVVAVTVWGAPPPPPVVSDGGGGGDGGDGGGKGKPDDKGKPEDKGKGGKG